MAKISPCFKKTFVFFNSLFAIFGIVIIALGLFGHQYAKKVATDSGEKTGFRTVAIALSVTGSVVFCIAFLGVYCAHKESKCPLIVFFTLMCLVTAGILCIAILLALNRPEMHCCRDRLGKVPDSCNCVNPNAGDMCETPCEPILTEYVLVFTMAVCFTLAALAILVGLMSLAMIILCSSRNSAATLPSLMNAVSDFSDIFSLASEIPQRVETINRALE